MAIEAAPATATSEAAPARSSAYRQANLRTGEDYLRALKEPRAVYIDGERVRDVTVHPAFREAANSVAKLFDVAAAPENRERMTYPSPRDRRAGVARLANSEKPCRPARQAPRRRKMGRGDFRPDGPHARPCGGLLRRLCGKACSCSPLRAGNTPTTSCKIYETSRATTTFTSTYAIVPPQIDRSKPAHQQKRSDALCRRRQGARRRHRDLGRAAARDRRACSRIVCISPASIRCGRATRPMRTAS